MKFIHVILLILIPGCILAQYRTLSGRVTDDAKKPLFAVNVYVNSTNKGTVTDINGNFSLKINPDIMTTDSLCFSFIGYQKQVIALNNIDPQIPLRITLLSTPELLNEIVIKAKEGIAHEFSMSQMNRLDIYLNPNSAADPLKAITLLPSSTNADESANVELRGSNAERSRVYFNGVPVYNPVKNSQITGMGFFSLFNTGMIEKQLVYASNPPLTFGNSSAGIVELETVDDIDKNDIQVSASLASIGLMINQKFNDNTFLQVYGNHQFSDAFLLLNKKSLNNLKYFKTNDIGLNQHYPVGKQSTLNLYSYYIDESSDIELNIFTALDNMQSERQRNFHIINYKYLKNKNLLTVNIGVDFSNSTFNFGNINSKYIEKSTYSSINYKRYFSEKFSIQTGMSSEYVDFNSNEQLPLFYYALSDTSPYIDTSITASYLSSEIFSYFNFKPTNKLSIGMGIRKGIDTKTLSYQLNLYYPFNSYNSLLLAGGHYCSYTRPNYYYKTYRDLESNQFVIEYTNKRDLQNIKMAAFLKNEFDELLGDKVIKGLEVFYERSLSKNFKFQASNIYIESDLFSNELSYQANNAFKYYFKFAVQYMHLKYCNLGLSFLLRPGKNYTPVESSMYNPQIGFYEPIYSDQINSKQYNKYNSFNANISKLWFFQKSQLIGFISISNILNTHNQRDIVYNHDYTECSYNYYQKRMIYFGIVLSLARDSIKKQRN